MSSIAQSCLHLAPVADQVERLQWDEDVHQNRDNRDILPLWLGEILSNGYPDENILATLESVLEGSSYVNCTIPKEGSSASIECWDIF